MARTSRSPFSRTGRFPLIWLMALCAMAYRVPPSADAARSHDVQPQEVEAAINKAKAYLYSQQQNGSWDEKEGKEQKQDGGVTALATYALLAAGESPQDPRIQKAVSFLETCQTQGIYAIGLRCQVWLNLPQPYKPEIKAAFERDAQALMKAAHPDPELHEGKSLFFRYVLDTDSWDHSCSQYGVLGIWACAQAGIEIPAAFWQGVDYGWRAHQYPDGGWSYEMSGNIGRPKPSPPGTPKDQQITMEDPTGAMTAAGVATLFITQEYLHGQDGVSCPGNIVDSNIEAGLDWMSEHFEEFEERYPFYTLYGIERIGVASGRKYLGNTDWFKEGAEFLVHHQGDDGNWEGISDTCFGLLFLARGRAPVVMNKLQYDITPKGQKTRPGNWNERPRDAANLVEWIGHQNERALNWQVVNLRVPVEDLHDAPILYIAGNQSLEFTGEEANKLRTFVEEGGLIFGNADCSSLAFDVAFRKLGKKLFGPYEFRDLPPTSPIYTNEQFMRDRWRHGIKIEALSNGARELMILVPTSDPSRYWQTQAYGGREELHQFIDDIFLYTVERGVKGGLRNKGESYVVKADRKSFAGKKIKIARLEYPGNWDPEPAGWRRLNAILHNTQQTDLVLTSVKLGEGKLDNSYKVAHLTGTDKFSLAADARAEIKKYVEGGGTLIIDGCGGSAEFAQSVDAEVAAIFPDSKMPTTPLPPDSPAFSVGPKLDQVEYRTYAKKVVGVLHEPRIRGVVVKGRLAVFTSAEDLSCGMVGMSFDGIFGYEPASATTLMEHLVLFAAK